MRQNLSPAFVRRRVLARVVTVPAALLSAAALLVMSLTGILMVVREYGMNHVVSRPASQRAAAAVGASAHGAAAPNGALLPGDMGGCARCAAIARCPSPPPVALCAVQMFDEDHLAVGHYIEQHTHPRAVMLHRDFHIFASGSIAGRPTLLAYTGVCSAAACAGRSGAFAPS